MINPNPKSISGIPVQYPNFSGQSQCSRNIIVIEKIIRDSDP